MSRSQVVMPRSIVAWHQSQADVRAGNGAVQRQDRYVNDVQRFGMVINIFEMRDRTEVRSDDEIPEAKRSRDQFDRIAVFSGERSKVSIKTASDTPSFNVTRARSSP